MDRRTFLQLAAASASVTGCKPQASARSAVRRPLRLLILGGTNYVGPALVRAARARGHHLTLFNRGITRPTLFHDVERRRGDRFPERDAGLSTLQSGEWDIVVDIPAYYPRHVAATANMLAPRARRYIMVSSIAAYSDWSLLQDWLSESRSLRPATGPKSFSRSM